MSLTSSTEICKSNTGVIFSYHWWISTNEQRLLINEVAKIGIEAESKIDLRFNISLAKGGARFLAKWNPNLNEYSIQKA